MSHSQYRQIRPRVSRDGLQPGDLVFFGGFGHVGMYVGQGRFIHSPQPGRRVTIEPLKGYWHGRMAGAVRPGWPRLSTRRVLRLIRALRPEAHREAAPMAPDGTDGTGGTR